MVETLIALMVIALGFAMLPGAVVAAARVNKSVEDELIFPESTLGENEVSAQNLDLRIVPASGSEVDNMDDTVEVRVYREQKGTQTGNILYYYGFNSLSEAEGGVSDTNGQTSGE